MNAAQTNYGPPNESWMPHVEHAMDVTGAQFVGGNRQRGQAGSFEGLLAPRIYGASALLSMALAAFFTNSPPYLYSAILLIAVGCVPALASVLTNLSVFLLLLSFSYSRCLFVCLLFGVVRFSLQLYFN